MATQPPYLNQSTPEYAPPVYPSQPTAGYAPIYPGQPPTGVVVPYADMGARFLAYLIDGLLTGIATTVVVVLLVVLAVPAISTESGWGGAIAGILIFLAVILPVALMLWYFPYNWSRTGQTPGQQLMRVRVVRKQDGQPLTLGMSLLRFIVGMGILDDVVFGLPIGYLWALWDPEKQAWHDKIANSIVVAAQ